MNHHSSNQASGPLQPGPELQIASLEQLHEDDYDGMDKATLRALQEHFEKQLPGVEIAIEQARRERKPVGEDVKQFLRKMKAVAEALEKCDDDDDQLITKQTGDPNDDDEPNLMGENGTVEKRFRSPGMTMAQYRWRMVAKRLARVAMKWKEFERATAPSSIRGINDSQRSATAVISSRRKDRQGDIVEIANIDCADFEQTGAPWLLQHQQDKAPVGTAIDPKTGRLSVRVVGDKLIATCWFHCLTEESRQTWELVRTGVLRATSVGLLPTDAQPFDGDDEGEHTPLHIRAAELAEVSWVSVPALPEAVVLKSAH